jgi:adenosylcobinamide-phosphate synthase
MQDIWLILEQHGTYFGFMFAALCSFFFSLPSDLNPLSAFALIFQQIASKVNLAERSDGYKRLASLLGFSLIFFPIVLIISQLYLVAFNPFVIDLIIIFVLLSWHDKVQVYQKISLHLQHNNLPIAKLLLDPLTLRDTKPLSLLGTNKAVIESLALNLANGWFAVIFWYLCTGIYGALFYQLMHICSRQWNHKLAQYQMLGQIPGLITQLLQFPVHILVSFTFSLYDKPIENLVSKFKQSVDWHHFSSGLLLSSFALSLKTQLGGVRLYDTEKVTYANLGTNTAPTIDRVTLALQRVSLSAWFWLICITGHEFLPHIIERFAGGI